MSKKTVQIADQQDALSAYINDMLLIPSLDEQITDPSYSLEPSLSNATKQVVNWQESPFQALIFEVHGLQLAIPLHELSGILTWPDNGVTKIIGKPKWHLGLFSQDRHHTQVIDTAHIIIPDQHQDYSAKVNFIILIDEGKWGLNCNQVKKVITLSPKEVRWRQKPGNRPWLAGTVLDQMCSILNIEELIKQFEN